MLFVASTEFWKRKEPMTRPHIVILLRLCVEVQGLAILPNSTVRRIPYQHRCRPTRARSGVNQRCAVHEMLIASSVDGVSPMKSH